MSLITSLLVVADNVHLHTFTFSLIDYDDSDTVRCTQIFFLSLFDDLDILVLYQLL